MRVRALYVPAAWLLLSAVTAAARGASDGERSGAAGSSAVRRSVQEQPCTNECIVANDGYCDDGGPGATLSLCALGTDCIDCNRPPPPPPPSPPEYTGYTCDLSSDVDVCLCNDESGSADDLPLVAFDGEQVYKFEAQREFNRKLALELLRANKKNPSGRSSSRVGLVGFADSPEAAALASWLNPPRTLQVRSRTSLKTRTHLRLTSRVCASGRPSPTTSSHSTSHSTSHEAANSRGPSRSTV